jgi:hypothetical protein
VTKNVLCDRCKQNVDIESSWCVIDTATKQRIYECKVRCKMASTVPPQPPPPVPQHPPSPERMIEPNDTLDTTESFESVHVENWSPTRDTSVFQRIVDWFQTPHSRKSGYMKVKTN